MKAFHYEKVKDPAWFQENRITAHSDHRYYGCVEEMEQKQGNFRYSLNGLGKSHYANNYRILERTSFNMSFPTFKINRQITTLATESSTGKPSIAPPIPISEPTEEKASER